MHGRVCVYFLSHAHVTVYNLISDSQLISYKQHTAGD